MRKYIFNKSWFVFAVLYYSVFHLSLGGVLTVVDEYEGGNALAEFGADVFSDVLCFPIFTLFEIFSWNINDKLIFQLLIVNTIINGFILTTLLNFFYVKLNSLRKNSVTTSK